MKTIIGRKQSSDNETFVRAWQHIEELVSKDEAAALVSKTVPMYRRSGTASGNDVLKIGESKSKAINVLFAVLNTMVQT